MYDCILNEMEILGVKGETQFDMILKTLLDFFNQFMPNNTMNMLMMSLSELMKELQMA